MPRRCKRRRIMAEMNVVPYIDVMLVLLVIFMVTAPMLQTGVQIDLPDANADTLKINGSPLSISIDATGTITLEDGKEVISEISEAELISQIAVKLGDNKKRPVNIRADSNIAYKNLMRIMVAAQKAGARKIGLVADIEQNKTE